MGVREGRWKDICNKYALLPQLDRTNSRSISDPATAEELGTIPEMGLSETKEAIDAASKAFKTWSRTTAKVGI